VAAFSVEEVAAIARLANLALTDEELALFARQLSDILAYAEQVQQVDTTGISPTAALAPRSASDRDDDVRASLDRATVLEQAPDAATEPGFFRVPRVIG
jgi:aspartyl-tRNA(Asn)/glutamyl-tRNA(Gln) amidotransferase subunit C